MPLLLASTRHIHSHCYCLITEVVNAKIIETPTNYLSSEIGGIIEASCGGVSNRVTKVFIHMYVNILIEIYVWICLVSWTRCG